MFTNNYSRESPKKYMICPIGNTLGNLWKIKERSDDIILLEKVHHSRSDFDFFDIYDNKVIVKITEHYINGDIYFQYHIQKNKKWISCTMITIK
jgi:hypothetical protein